MFLSVVVPVYNVESYLEQCISSILNQTMRDIEVILVDDGSTDSSGMICDNYANSDVRIIVIHQKNKGLIEARKKGVKSCAGEYVTFVDSDDFIDCNSYIQALKSMQKEIDVICFDKISYTENGKILRHSKFRDGYYSKKDLIEVIYPEMIWNALDDTFGLDPSLCTKIIKKELLIKSYALLKETDFYYGEDSAIIYPLLKMANSLEIIHYAYYYHRQRKKTQCASYISDVAFFDKLYLVYKYLRAYFGDDATLVKQIEQFYMYSVNLKRRAYKLSVKKGKYVFPFDKVEKGERIVLYGAGTVGQKYREQLLKCPYCTVVLWVDSDYMSYEHEDIVNVECIRTAQYDKIVIAIANLEISQAIKENLIKMGVESERVILG